MLTFRSHHFRFKALLTIWMTVVSAGVSLSHCHAPESPEHQHNHGWFSICVAHWHGGLPADPQQPHRHLVILGWELSGETDTNPQSPASPTAKLTAAVDGACVTMPVLIPDTDAVFVEYVTVETGHSVALAQVPGDSLPLSPFARHLVSGVLRS